MGSVFGIFSRSHNIGSIIIRGVTWSPWSHNALILEDGEGVIEAVWPQGVRQSNRTALQARSTQIDIVEIEVPNPAGAYAYARSQIGKPYDTWGVIGLGLRREWDTPDAWWCSELFEACLIAAGRPRFNRHAQRVTPMHSYMAV